jgi:hypothetical protein
MNRRLLAAGFMLGALIIAGMGLPTIATGVAAQSDETPLPEVETAVAATLTALAPTLEGIRPTIPPSRTPTPTNAPRWGIIVTHSPDFPRTEAEALNATLPQHWRNPALGTARYEVRLAQRMVIIEVCHYSGGHTIARKRRIVSATIDDLETRQTVANEEFEGMQPENCGSGAFFRQGETSKEMVGDFPPVREVTLWLSSHMSEAGLEGLEIHNANETPHRRYVTSVVLTMRTCPQSACKVVGHMENGDEFFATGQATDQDGAVWYSLTHEGDTVWVAGWFTSAEPPTD